MRYRQANQPHKSSDQRAKDLIKSDDVLSTSEQEDVIAYFASSLSCSTQFFKVVICLQMLLALVYVVLLLSGSLLFDLDLDADTAARLTALAQQQQQQAETRFPVPMATPTAPADLVSLPPPTTQDPLSVLAVLDAQQRDANRRFVGDYLQRREGRTSSGKLRILSDLFSASVMLYSAALLLWAAWTGYLACRQLRVNVEELTSTVPRELGTKRAAPAVAAATATSPSLSTPQDTEQKALYDNRRKPTGSVHENASLVSLISLLRQRLRRRARDDPPATQYLIAALAGLASVYWVLSLWRRTHALQHAYANLGLPAPSMFGRAENGSSALLAYVLALWQPLFHLCIGRLLRSMLDTKENLIALSNMKYHFDKV